jgi:hypothetical protein
MNTEDINPKLAVILRADVKGLSSLMGPIARFIPMLLLTIVLVPTLVCSTDTNRISYHLKPELIVYEIESSGARAVVNELYSDWDVWDFVLKKIGSGDESWLKVAVALHPGSDAGSAEMLNLAVGEALEHNPENVFKITLNEFRLNSICSGADVDDARYNTYELSLEAINVRIQKVSSVKAPSFESTKKECIRNLEKSKDYLADFYGVKKK